MIRQMNQCMIVEMMVIYRFDAAIDYASNPNAKTRRKAVGVGRGILV